MPERGFDPSSITASEEHRCGAFSPCLGRGVLTVGEIVRALDASSCDGQVNEWAFRKRLGLPHQSVPVIGVHVNGFGQSIDINPAA